jgi:hypothetical protein
MDCARWSGVGGRAVDRAKDAQGLDARRGHDDHPRHESFCVASESPFDGDASRRYQKQPWSYKK